MGAWLWELPSAGQSEVIEALSTLGMRVEPAPTSSQIPPLERWYVVIRGRVSQTIVVRGSELTVHYRLTWPWNWRAEMRLVDQIFRTFDSHCKRLI